VRLAKPQPTTTNNNNEGVQGSVTSVHLQSSKPEYITADDDQSQLLCRWQFDVSGYGPAEISVKVDAGRLSVSARHADVKDADNTSSRQLNKQMDIPGDVIIDEMTSYMTSDGVLVIQAPVSGGSRDVALGHVTSPRSEVKMAAVNGVSAQDLDCRFRPIDLPPEQPSSDDAMSASRRHVIKTGFTDAIITATA